MVEFKDEMQIRVSIEPILKEHAECIICMNILYDPQITKCGHTFCKECILEVVNRQHLCPECREPLQQQEVFKNYSFGLLLNDLQKEQEKQKQLFFESLSAQAVQNQNLNQAEYGPIQEVFASNLKRSLLSYQEYFESIKQQRDQTMQKIQSTMNAQIMEAKDKQMKDQVDQLQIQAKEQLDKVNNKFSRTSQALVSQYDEHMKQIACEPKLLPIRINVIVKATKQQYRIDNLQVETFENIEGLLKDKLETYFDTTLKDKVVNWNLDKLSFILRGPLAQENEQPQGQQDINQMNQIVQINDLKVSFDQLNVAQASTIEILGGPIELLSDAPKECMSIKFVKDAGKTYDYYSCKNCNINWICEECHENCHKSQGHQTLLHVKQHVPSYACCYCMKHQKCQIINIRNKK